MTLSFQSKMISFNAKVLDKLKLLNETFDKLEADFAVTRKANSLLSSGLVDTKRQCWANAQYTRRETLEIRGLTKSFTNNEAKTKCAKFFEV